MTSADRRRHLVGAFSVALAEMGLLQQSGITYSVYDLSAGASVSEGNEDRWLRVKWQYSRRRDRDGWAASAAIPGVAKARWYRTQEFLYEGEGMRADLLSLAPSPACARGLILDRRPAIDDAWLAELRRSVEALERWPTDRVAIRPDRIEYLVLGRVGSGFPSRVQRFVASHSDLHWCNVTAPTFCLLDWDHWGLAPYGYGPASLYCSALLQPEIAEAVFCTFRDQLETHDGRISLLLAADRLLNAVRDEEFREVPEIADALHGFVRTLAG